MAETFPSYTQSWRAQHKELPAAISAKVDGQSQNEVHTVKEELREKEEIKGF